MPQRYALLALLALTVLCFVDTAARAQTLHPAPPAHSAPSHHKPAVRVHIKNGPIIRGRLPNADTDSIRLEVENAHAPITFDIEEVAGIDFPMTGVAKKEARKDMPESAPQAVAEVFEAPIGVRRVAPASGGSISDSETEAGSMEAKAVVRRCLRGH